jgi:membrane-anchored protein YejM (alkaline phosphatase superfamily)
MSRNSTLIRSYDRGERNMDKNERCLGERRTSHNSYIERKSAVFLLSFVIIAGYVFFQSLIPVLTSIVAILLACHMRTSLSNNKEKKSVVFLLSFIIVSGYLFFRGVIPIFVAIAATLLSGDKSVHHIMNLFASPQITDIVLQTYNIYLMFMGFILLLAESRKWI